MIAFNGEQKVMETRLKISITIWLTSPIAAPLAVTFNSWEGTL
jgi:hypothetical protein